ncbi:MAG: peroxidase-related enzyme [Pseudomonadales bacterium]|jgi:uncharacterized peroxidase-related enzyme|tara:strand:- start:1477 stop:2055 length:579 start_codon:yes stop_codon:yes gene_type:complete
MSESIIRSGFDLPVLAALPQDLQDRLAQVQEKSGFLPNIFVALARRPDEFRAFFAYHDALLEQQHGKLTKADKEMIIVTTSALNDCHYCIIAHGAILRIRAKNPLISDQVAINYRKADITPEQRAMLDFACAVALRSGSVSDAEIQVLIDLGFSHEDVWDILAITAFFAMSNRLANVASIRPNSEFYALGRG